VYNLISHEDTKPLYYTKDLYIDCVSNIASTELRRLLWSVRR